MAAILSVIELDCLGVTSAFPRRIHSDVLDAAERAFAKVYRDISNPIAVPNPIGQGSAGSFRSHSSMLPTNGPEQALQLVGEIVSEDAPVEGWEDAAQAWLEVANAEAVSAAAVAESVADEGAGGWDEMSTPSRLPPGQQGNISGAGPLVYADSSTPPLYERYQAPASASSTAAAALQGRENTTAGNGAGARLPAGTASGLGRNPAPFESQPLSPDGLAVDFGADEGDEMEMSSSP